MTKDRDTKYEAPELIDIETGITFVEGSTSSGLPGGDDSDHDIF